MQHSTRLIAALTLMVAVAACGAEETDPTADATAPESTTTSGPPTPAESPRPDGQPAPQTLRFEATTVDGTSFDAASVAGEPVVFWFWAPWCAVCRSQIPTVTGLAAEGATVVGIGSLDSGEAIADFATQTPGVLQLSDPDGVLWQRFGITEQSSFVVLDAAGDEVLRTGYDDDGALADTVAGLGS